MKRHTSLLILTIALSAGAACSSSKSTTVGLRGKLINAPEDYYLVLCNTGEKLWVDVYALQPWWKQVATAVDAGTGLVPPLYVEMDATLQDNGPYGHAEKTNREVWLIKDLRTVSADIPADCSR
jgi:hypothetical protein